VNGYFEDPCLFVRLVREKRAILVDLGDISKLKWSEIYKITDVFVTHTHIDHFIGFDTILRAVLRRDMPLNIYGPPNIVRCIEGKLKGYAWNVISEYPCVLNVFSFNGRTLSHLMFRSKNRFKKERVNISESNGVLLNDPLFKVRAIVLDHGISCLAYSIEENFHININKDLLLKRGLKVGPWLSELKKSLREGNAQDHIIEIDDAAYTVSELKDIASVSKGQKISYVTDIAMSKKNIERISAFVKDSDILYCEAYFLEKDRQRALERYHLTAKTCGSIAKKACVKKLVPIHFSPKYSDCPGTVLDEALTAYSANKNV
jgi:ribonuclease Z